MNNKICTKCRIELRCKQNGVILVEMCVHEPMAIWRADLWHCPECGLEVIPGTVGQTPEIRNEGSAAQLAAFRARLDSYELDKTLCDEVNRPLRVIRFWLNVREKQIGEHRQGNTMHVL